MHGWQANKRTHLRYASEKGLCPKNKNHVLCTWMIILLPKISVTGVDKFVFLCILKEVKEYPEADIENAVSEFKAIYEEYAAQGDMELEDFVEAQGLTMDYFEEQSQQYAEMKVKQNLIIQGIMDAEGMTLDDEECLAIQDQLIQDYAVKDLAELVDQYGQAAVDESIGLLRVENFIVDNAQVNELVSNGELVGQDGGAGTEEDAGETVEEEQEEQQ